MLLINIIYIISIVLSTIVIIGQFLKLSKRKERELTKKEIIQAIFTIIVSALNTINSLLLVNNIIPNIIFSLIVVFVDIIFLIILNQDAKIKIFRYN